MFTSLLKDIMKDTDEQPDEAMGVGRSQMQKLLSQWSWHVSPSDTWMCSPPLEALPAPYFWHFMEASSCRHDRLLTHFQPLSPF